MRLICGDFVGTGGTPFPFLFGGTFIEAGGVMPGRDVLHRGVFPFLFGGTFIEAAWIIILWCNA